MLVVFGCVTCVAVGRVASTVRADGGRSGRAGRSGRGYSDAAGREEITLDDGRLALGVGWSTGMVGVGIGFEVDAIGVGVAVAALFNPSCIWSVVDSIGCGA